MTFEDTETLAPFTAEQDHGAGVWPVRPATRHSDHPLDGMLRFVAQASLMAEDLDGLAHLFRSTFEPEDGRLDPKLYAASEVVATCIESIAGRLRLIEDHANLHRQHLGQGGAR